ncbi:PREDICTED: DEAD-box ATP-dependent RNA helicase 50 isoform X2 [Nelumbo nucifera]|nr:PREDICTED: DEAD-box ATP-dependent RNA helicase 50 isoform X2 [Nelumbo nucifera]
MIRKSSRTKHETGGSIHRESGAENLHSNLSDISDPEIEFAKKNKSTGHLRHIVRMSRASQSEKIKDMFQGSEVPPGTRSSEVTQEHPFRNQTTSSEAHEHDNEDAEPFHSVSGAPTAYLRKWGNGEPMQNSRFGSLNLLKKQRKLSTDSGFFSRKSFKDLGYSDYMIESLRAQSFIRPSHIQGMTFAPVIEGKSCIIADQSGSGKTLAYLAPVVQRLRQEELQGLGNPSSRSPRVVILVPTAELASQVLKNCRSMSKCGVPFRSMVATGGFRQKTQLENLEQDLDVLIATPGRFIFLLQEGFLHLTNLKCAILDEVDILFSDEEFEQALQSLINSAPLTTQYLFVTATLPVDIYNKLVEVFPDCEVIMGPGMHRTSSGLEEVLVDCSGDDGTEKTPETAFLNKKSALLQLAEESPVPKTIVFCNKIETCRKIENVLRRFDRKGVRIRVLPFHAALAQEARLANIKEFSNPFSEVDSLFLICTDRASRGIDFSGVDHVVLFDFPRDPSEYVRRVGRTARGAGGKGKAFVFVVGKQVSLARRIIERNIKGHPLHDVPSAYELMS